MFDNYFIYIIVFIFGLSIGSFLNVVVLRYPEFVSIATTRSHCPSCKKILKWYDLFPFFSFVFLSGKCRYCRMKISWQYPLVEIVTAVISTLVIFKFGISWQGVIILLLSYLMIVISVFDITSMEIPDFFLWLMLGASVLYVLFGQFGFTNYSIGIYNALIGMAVYAGFPLLIVLLTREKGMGMGDFKIGLPLGLVVGYPLAVVGLFMSIFAGSIFGLGLVFSKSKKLKDAMPFGPFMVFGFFIALFFGEWLWKLYFNL